MVFIKEMLDADTHLWATRFSEQDPAQFWPTLSKQEQALAEKRVGPRLQQHAILSLGLRRAILAGLLNKQPEDLVFELVENKKPLLQQAPLHFNVSHSDDYWVMVVHPHRPVGIDIECKNRSVEFLELAERFFTIEEAHLIKASTNPSDIFWQLWTAKEALLKATGKGIVHGLHVVQLSVDVKGKMQIVSPTRLARSFRLMQKTLYPGTLLTVAIPQLLDNENN